MIVEINVKAGDAYDGKTAAIVLSAEGSEPVLRADTSKVELTIEKGTQVNNQARQRAKRSPRR